MKKILLAFSILMLATGSFAQDSAKPRHVATFKFTPGDGGFYALTGNNAENLDRLYMFIDNHLERIASGEIPIRVDGYSTSLLSSAENRKLACVRANRVKSELIVDKGLMESHFITRNFASRYEGRGDIVVVTIEIPMEKESVVEIEQAPIPEPEPEPEPMPVAEPEPEPAPQPVIEPAPEPVQTVVDPVAPWRDRYVFALRTNLLYDGFALPTIGVEWRINRHVGVKLDASGSYWGDEHGKVQKIWMVNPEARWYMGTNKRFYVGLSCNFGEANLYGYPLGSIMEALYSDDTGYQGGFYGGGVVVGYQLRLARMLSLDFNIGLGYTRFEYDTFNIRNGVRVYKDKNITKDFWGPTQAGISLGWRIGAQ